MDPKQSEYTCLRGISPSSIAKHPNSRKETKTMRRFVKRVVAFGILFVGSWAALTCKHAAAAGDDEVVLQADRAFVQAIAKSDKASLGKLLDADFAWTNSEGKTQTKAEILQDLPTPVSGYDAEAKERTYGRVAA